MKLVSIVMPSFNSEKYILEAIESIVCQSYSNWELLVIDNGSTDASLELIRSYTENDIRVSLHHASHKGASYARNKGIEVSKGDYIAFIDSDDIWDHNKLKASLEYMELNSIFLLCTAYTPISYDGSQLYNKRVPLPEITRNRLLKTCDIGCSTVVIRVDCFSERHQIPKFPNVKKEDYAYWFKLLDVFGCSFYGMQDSFTNYRIHSGGVSSNKFTELVLQYKIYKNFLSLGIINSVLYSCFYIYYGIRKTYFND